MRLFRAPVSRCRTTSLVLRHVVIIAALPVVVFQASPAGATRILYTLDLVSAEFPSFNTYAIKGAFTADPTVLNTVTSASPVGLTVTGLSSGPTDFNGFYGSSAFFVTFTGAGAVTELMASSTDGRTIGLLFAPPISPTGTSRLVDLLLEASPSSAPIETSLVSGDVTPFPTGAKTGPGTGPTTVPEAQSLWLLGAAIALFSLLRRCVTL